MTKLINVLGKHRNCECCGSNAFELLWVNKYNVLRTTSGLWSLPGHNVICPVCGFIFVSPVASSEQLNEYYKDAYVHFSGSVMDFDPDIRTEALLRAMEKAEVKLTADSTFVEVGCSTHTQFHKNISSMFNNVITVEVNAAVDCNYKSLFDLDNESVDVLTHYFVLEHIPELRLFIQKCFDTLKQGGIMLLEVPDLKLYEQYPNCLKFAEHVNHFTVENLHQICQSIGFTPIGAPIRCSRPFGFAVAYKKTGMAPDLLPTYRASLYKDNMGLFQRVVGCIEQFEERAEAAFSVLVSHCAKGGKATLWAANDNLLHFVNNKTLPDNAVIIDSDPQKANFAGDNKVFQPVQMAEHIVQSELLIIFSELNRDAILRFLRNSYGKTFKSCNIITLAQ